MNAKINKSQYALGAAAEDIGLFLSDLAPTESEEMMENLREAMRLASEDGRSAKVSMTIEAKPGDEDGQFNIVIQWDIKASKRQRSFSGLSMIDGGQLSWEEQDRKAKAEMA